MNDLPETDGYHQLVEKLILEKANILTAYDSIAACLHQHVELFSYLHSIPACTIYYSHEPALNVSFYGTPQNFRNVWSTIRRAGFVPEFRPAADTKLPTFSTYFKKENFACKIWFCFSSSVCTRKQVGTETKEVPIYEVVCSESLAADLESLD